MFKINKYQKLGIVFIFIAILLFFSNNLDLIIRPLTKPVLMGSSKGKDILFFAIFGIFLIFSNIEEGNIVQKIPWPRFLRKDNNNYLKLSFFLLLFLAKHLTMKLEVSFKNLRGVYLLKYFFFFFFQI